jgi:hypothetical protein
MAVLVDLMNRPSERRSRKVARSLVARRKTLLERLDASSRDVASHWRERFPTEASRER